MPFERLEARIDGVCLIQPQVFGDERGFFVETYRRNVFVELRRGSPTYTEWEAFELSAENGRIVYCPIGFAHGFCVVSEIADVFYKQSNYYSDERERGIKYDDPEVGIEWPLPTDELIASERDATAPTLAEVADGLPFEFRPS